MDMFCYLYIFSSKKSLFVSIQLRLCGRTNGSTRSITWSRTLSILSSYWLIMFPDTPHLWQQILVSRLSHCDPYCQLILKKKKKQFQPFKKKSSLSDEVPVVAAFTPLLLLAAVVFIISLLSRTMWVSEVLFSHSFSLQPFTDHFSVIASTCSCKSYFFPIVSSPWRSKMGHWLMNPTPQVILFSYIYSCFTENSLETPVKLIMLPSFYKNSISKNPINQLINREPWRKRSWILKTSGSWTYWERQASSWLVRGHSASSKSTHMKTPLRRGKLSSWTPFVFLTSSRSKKAVRTTAFCTNRSRTLRSSFQRCVRTNTFLNKPRTLTWPARQTIYL